MAKPRAADGPLVQLAEAVKSGDEDRIFRAALGVGDAGDAAAVPALLRLLKADPRIRVKNGAAIALRELGANEAVPHLIGLIEHVDFRNHRGTFVYALQTLDWHSKYSHVIARLLTDLNFEVRSMALDALEAAAGAMSGDEKGTMLAALLFRLAANFHFPARLPEDVAKTVEAAVPLLVTKKSMRAAERVLA